MAKKKEPEFVSKAEFNAFADRIVSLVEGMVMPPAPTVTNSPMQMSAPTGTAPQYSPSNPHPDTQSPDPTAGILPAQYQSMFDKYFDPVDGFEGRLNFPEMDEKGNENGGITFTIIVPMKHSNTDDGYRKMYKNDLRTRALMPNNIVKGMEDWCQRVVKNLNYKRNIQTK